MLQFGRAQQVKTGNSILLPVSYTTDFIVVTQQLGTSGAGSASNSDLLDHSNQVGKFTIHWLDSAQRYYYWIAIGY